MHSLFLFKKKQVILYNYNYIIQDLSDHYCRSHLIFQASIFAIYQLDSGNLVFYCIDFNCPKICKIAVSLRSKQNYFPVVANKGEKEKPLSYMAFAGRNGLYITRT